MISQSPEDLADIALDLLEKGKRQLYLVDPNYEEIKANAAIAQGYVALAQLEVLRSIEEKTGA